MRHVVIDNQWFADRLAYRRLSQRGLAKLMGLDPSALSLMLRGKRKITIEEAAQLSVLLDVSTTEVLERAGITPHGEHKVKLIGYRMPDGSVQRVGDGLHEMIDSPPNAGADCVAIQARTAGSTVEAIDGWIFFANSEHGNPAQSIGHFCLLAIKDNGLKMKHIKRGYKKGTYNLLDWKGELVQSNAQLAWASQIIWIKTQ